VVYGARWTRSSSTRGWRPGPPLPVENGRWAREPLPWPSLEFPWNSLETRAGPAAYSL